MWNPLPDLMARIQGNGGFVNAHAHFDRAYSVTPQDLAPEGAVHHTLHDKWKLVEKYKKMASEEDIYQSITACLRHQKAQGVQACLSFIDCDPVIEDRAILAAIRAKKYASETLQMRFVTACQTLMGVIEPSAKKWFHFACERVDIIGGLPGADKGNEALHVSTILGVAKELKKRAHIHVDQLNSAHEIETEHLARQVIEQGMHGKVTAVHGISIGAHPQRYRNELYALCLDAGLSFVACPTAWIDSRRTEILSPTHNALTPVDELIPAGLIVAIGSDNIADIYKPFSDGNMATELRVLLEGNHFYDVQKLLDIATINGLKVLGLQ